MRRFTVLLGNKPSVNTVELKRRNSNAHSWGDRWFLKQRWNDDPEQRWKRWMFSGCLDKWSLENCSSGSPWTKHSNRWLKLPFLSKIDIFILYIQAAFFEGTCALMWQTCFWGVISPCGLKGWLVCFTPMSHAPISVEGGVGSWI